MGSHGAVEREVDALADLSREELARRWQRAFSNPPPRGVSRALLELGIAWHLQVRHHGGPTPSTSRHLQKLARLRFGGGSDAAGLAEAEPGVVGRDGQGTMPAMKLLPGMRLVREWHGRTCQVDVTEDGFLFEGRHFASLSVIARLITGAHWSGPRFFGLRRGKSTSRRDPNTSKGLSP